MEYLEYSIITNTFGSELVAEVLSELSSEGVAIYDSDDLESMIKSDIIWDYIDDALLEKNEQVRVLGFFQDNSLYADLLSRLVQLKANAVLPVGSLEVSSRVIAEQDWCNVWRQYYQPISIGEVTIVPNWVKYDAREDEFIVRLDPGMAFGTGTHESTQLCIELYVAEDYREKSVIDIGTGSGILGICAGVCGASSVKMYDIDEIAVVSARNNIAMNHINCPIVVENSDLLDKLLSKADIIFANITADILMSMASEIGDYLNNDGVLIVSGIIHDRLSDVVKCYKDNGFVADKIITKGEWKGVKFRR